jgi:hypothetical protein
VCTCYPNKIFVTDSIRVRLVRIRKVNIRIRIRDNPYPYLYPKLSVSVFESDYNYENEYDIINIRLYPIRLHPYSLVVFCQYYQTSNVLIPHIYIVNVPYKKWPCSLQFYLVQYSA